MRVALAASIWVLEKSAFSIVDIYSKCEKNKTKIRIPPTVAHTTSLAAPGLVIVVCSAGIHLDGV